MLCISRPTVYRFTQRGLANVRAPFATNRSQNQRSNDSSGKRVRILVDTTPREHHSTESIIEPGEGLFERGKIDSERPWSAVANLGRLRGCLNKHEAMGIKRVCRGE